MDHCQSNSAKDLLSSDKRNSDTVPNTTTEIEDILYQKLKELSEIAKEDPENLDLVVESLAICEKLNNAESVYSMCIAAKTIIDNNHNSDPEMIAPLMKKATRAAEKLNLEKTEKELIIKKCKESEEYYKREAQKINAETRAKQLECYLPQHHDELFKLWPVPARRVFMLRAYHTDLKHVGFDTLEYALKEKIVAKIMNDDLQYDNSNQTAQLFQLRKEGLREEDKRELAPFLKRNWIKEGAPSSEQVNGWFGNDTNALTMRYFASGKISRAQVWTHEWISQFVDILCDIAIKNKKSSSTVKLLLYGHDVGTLGCAIYNATINVTVVQFEIIMATDCENVSTGNPDGSIFTHLIPLHSVIEHSHPDIVVDSWPEPLVDNTKIILNQRSTQAYVVIGDPAWNTNGRSWETWGLHNTVPELLEAVPEERNASRRYTNAQTQGFECVIQPRTLPGSFSRSKNTSVIAFLERKN